MKFLSSDRPTIINFRRRPDDIDDTLELANDTKTMITATTIAPDSVRDKKGNLITVEPAHLYEVVSYDAKNGTVTVANPWGSNYLDTSGSLDAKLKEDPANAFVPSKYDHLRNELFPSSNSEQQTGKYLTMTVDQFKSRFVEITYASISD